MDLPNIPNVPVNYSNPSPAKGLTTTSNRNIFYLVMGIAAVVIVIELVWAYSVFYRPIVNTTSTKPASVIENAPVVENIGNAVITLSSPKETIKVGDKITVTVKIRSDQPTDGTDLVLKYDPNFFEVVLSGSGVPMVVNNLYSEYPINKVDTGAGVVSVSGIASEANGSLVDGVFGSIIFKAKIAGSSKFRVDFKPGLTSDSNIIETKTGEDILGSVNTLEVKITP